MIPVKIKKFLDAAPAYAKASADAKALADKSAGKKYGLLQHKTVYTAYDKAATLRLPPKIVGKTLVVKLDVGLALVTISANRNLDKKKFLKVAGAKKLEFVTERIMKNKLKGVKMGAVPPFGNLWKLPTFTDRGLMANPKIILNSGDNNWSIKIAPSHYKKLVPELVIGNFGKKR